MDTASAKKFNQRIGFRPDPTVAFFDALAANTAETKIMKLTKVPNTKGKYLAQYLDTSGVVSIYQWNGSKDHFVVYRVLPTGVIKYYFEADTKTFKNENSRNHYLVGTLGEVYKNIIAYRKNLQYKNYNEGIQLVMNFKRNLDSLCDVKKDTTLTLRKVVSAITGKVCVGFEEDAKVVVAMAALSKLRSIIGDMDYDNDIIYKK